MAGQVEAKHGVVPGKTYVVWSDRGTIKATDEQAGELTLVEEERLQDDWKRHLDASPRLDKFITDRAWKVGEKVELSPDELKDARMSDDEISTAAGTAMLTASDGKIATFVLDLVLEQKAGDGTMKIPAQVDVTVDIAKSRPRSMKMTGTMAGDIHGAHIEGTIEASETTTYP